MTEQKFAPWPQARVDVLIQMRAAGASTPEIANALEISPKAVRDKERRLDVGKPTVDNRAWPPDKIERLREYCASGLTGSQIGELMGLSRSAVIGIVFREKFRLVGSAQQVSRTSLARASNPTRKLAVAASHRGAATQRARAQAAKSAPQSPKELEVPPAPPRAILDPPATARSVMTIGSRQCHWPVSDPGQGRMDEMLMCAAATDEGVVYCPDHAALAFSHTAPKLRAPREHFRAHASAKSYGWALTI